MSFNSKIYAQKNSSSIQVRFEFAEAPLELEKKYKDKIVFKDSIAAKTNIENLIEKFRVEGYIAANLDEIVASENEWLVSIYVGKQFQWFSLRKGNLPQYFLEKAGVHLSDMEGKPINLRSFNELTETLIQYAENNGFPFAKLELDSIHIQNDKVTASLKYHAGSPIYFDTLLIISNAKINRDFLAKHLQISQTKMKRQESIRMLYNQKKVDMIPELIDRLPFLELARRPEVIFEEDRAVIKLYLNQVPTNQVDALVGLLPKSSENEKMNITGQFELNLMSPFGKGKNIYTKWQKVKPQSPVYQFSYEHPYIFNSNFNLGLSLNSLQEDTTFRNLDFELGLGFKLNERQNLNLNYFTFQSNILNGSHLIEGLPNGRAKTNFKSVGILYEFGNPRFNQNSISNFYAALNVKVGNKEILQAQPDTTHNFITKDYAQTILTTQLKKAFRINSTQNVLLKQNGGIILSEEMYLNDMFRVGGYKLLRGFNENQFYTSSYLVNTLEWHFTFDKTSYFFVFLDQAITENRIMVNDAKLDFPIGVGTGVSLNTKPGIFTLMWSMGKSKNQDFTYRSSKIHFGLINVF
ncbi:hypothetical protein [Flexithrix dorotheae]|uniref:hypothetical protein n=1 Tax=Flexithrix dorotheae TaxID=70993 RepID=UPI00039EB1EA|nr:hypothetical protein [Flexithrix dorotheae]